MALQVLGRCVIQLAFRQCHLGGLLKARECRLAGKRHEWSKKKELKVFHAFTSSPRESLRRRSIYVRLKHWPNGKNNALCINLICWKNEVWIWRSPERRDRIKWCGNSPKFERSWKHGSIKTSVTSYVLNSSSAPFYRGVKTCETNRNDFERQ